MNKQIITYCSWAFGITWTIVTGQYILFRKGILTVEQLNNLHSLGALGPALAAIITTQRYYKKEGLRKLFAALSLKRLERKSILVALSPIALFGLGMLTYSIYNGNTYSFEPVRQEFHLSGFISYLLWMLPFIVYGIFEEPGWRGFLLPMLQSRYNAFKAICYLTLIWGAWHLPFFLYRFKFEGFIVFGFFIGLFIGAIIMTFLFNQSRGSLLTVILFHVTNNFASAFDKEYIVAVLSTGFLIIAIYLIVRYKTKNLSDHNRQTDSFISGR